jgi:uncharacterized protein
MFLDTSGLLAYLFDSEIGHSISVTQLESSEIKFTHNYVLAELVALTSARRYPRHVVLDFLADVMAHPGIDIVWVDRRLHAEALSLLDARLDKSYSLCDAVSFVLMRQRRVDTALTTDRHFVQEGFRRLLESAA